MTTDLLPAETHMGQVTLRANDVSAMRRWYEEGVGLEPLSDEAGVVRLGAAGDDIISIEEAPQLRRPNPADAGLFHTAILYPDQASLAAAVVRMASMPGIQFAGTGDHLVSEAFYFVDPEGNGVELYADRPRVEWSWKHGRVEMSTGYIDPNAFVGAHLTDDAAAAPIDATVGHVHLQVGDTTSAKRFYVDTLGFEITATLGTTALFVSAGGYHHHMAMNVWNSAGAGRRADTLGLGIVDIEVPGRDALGALAERVTAAGIQLADDGRTLSFDDPWANRIRVTAG